MNQAIAYVISMSLTAAILIIGLASLLGVEQSAQAVTDFSLGQEAGNRDGKANAQNNNSTFNADTYTAANGECEQQGHSFSYCQGYKTGYNLGFGGIDKLFR
jgi:hypothetical protein